jgi:hypothetical protein
MTTALDIAVNAQSGRTADKAGPKKQNGGFIGLPEKLPGKRKAVRRDFGENG